ncbi:hypothetical protein Plhal703r1_c48g0151041 [Plasmopara halstedii]
MKPIHVTHLQFRLAFHLLPVRSRFWFLEKANPSIRYCVRNGCDAIETEQHLVFDWMLHHSSGGRCSSWYHRSSLSVQHGSTLLLLRRCAYATTGKLARCVGDVWHVLRAVTLHFLWSDRNRCLFDNRQPTPALAAIKVIFTTFFAHVRYFQRRLPKENTSMISAWCYES